jgi:hypothetical protein
MKHALMVAVCLAAGGIAGCTGSKNVNLTPRRLPATASSTYLFETTFDTRRRGADPESVIAWVDVDATLYPMNRVPNTVNRFEAMVPLPPGKTYVPYKYKFEFAYPGVRDRQRNSTWSPEYRLIVPQQ